MIDSEVYRMSFLRKIKSLGVKAFVGGEWKVAYRPLSKNNGDYQIVNAPKGMFLFFMKSMESTICSWSCSKKKRIKPVSAVMALLMGRLCIWEKSLKNHII